MRKGYKITLGLITIMILLTISVGTSYSYYSISDIQKEENNLTTTCFKIDFSGSNDIALNTAGKFAYPMSDVNAANKLTPYTFTITNSCTTSNAASGVNYEIVFNTKGDLNDYIRYKLDEGATLGTATALTDAQPYTYAQYFPTSKKMVGTVHSYKLKSGTLAPAASQTYKLLLWIDENACSGEECDEKIMAKTFEGQILVLTSMGVLSS